MVWVYELLRDRRYSLSSVAQVCRMSTSHNPLYQRVLERRVYYISCKEVSLSLLRKLYLLRRARPGVQIPCGLRSGQLCVAGCQNCYLATFLGLDPLHHNHPPTLDFECDYCLAFQQPEDSDLTSDSDFNIRLDILRRFMDPPNVSPHGHSLDDFVRYYHLEGPLNRADVFYKNLMSTYQPRSGFFPLPWNNQ